MKSIKSNIYNGCGVYFISVCGYCKIGFSQNIHKRLATLQTGNPFTLELTLYIPLHKEDLIRVENDLHSYFRAKRFRGEWFKLDESDIELIEEHYLPHSH